MPETTPLIKAALNLRAGAGFDVYKQATPKAAFVFHVPLANEQPAKQAGKRVSAGSRADESTKEKQATQKGI